MGNLFLLSLSCCLATFGLIAGVPNVVSDSPYIVVVDGFLSDFECDYLVAQAKPFLMRSTVVNNSGGSDYEDNARTSEGAFLARNCFDAVLVGIENKIVALTRIPPENGEDIHVLHYGVGAEYKPHFDYFDRSTLGGRQCLSRGGQRLATLIMYLNTVESGGETIFPKVPFSCAPIKGRALLFYNCTADGSEDPMTLHGGSPVIAGEKWIATKWIRQGIFN